MKPDRSAPVRRARVLQALLFQAGLAVILVTFLLLSWGDVQGMLLFGTTLLIPVGWGWAFYDAYRRDEAAREEGRWTRETEKAERKRVFTRLGALFAVWLVLAALIVLLL